MKRVALKSSRSISQKRKKIAVVISLIILSILFCLGAIYFLLRLPIFIIKDIKVSGIELISERDLKESVEKDLEGSYFYIIPKNNVYFYPKKKIQENLRNQFLRIENLEVSIEKKFVEIKLSEKSAFAIWCNESCYYIDDDGFVFGFAPDFGGNVFLRFEGGIEGDPLKQNFLNHSYLESAKKIHDFFEKEEVYIERVSATSSKETAFVGDYGEKFLVSLDRDANETIENIKAIFLSEKFKDKSAMLRKLDYLDARFGNKIYFSEKKGVSEAESAE